jgi:hypothetical protein
MFLYYTLRVGTLRNSVENGGTFSLSKGGCDFRLRLSTAKYKYYVAFHSLTIRHTFIISQGRAKSWKARVKFTKHALLLRDCPNRSGYYERFAVTHIDQEMDWFRGVPMKNVNLV